MKLIEFGTDRRKQAITSMGADMTTFHSADDVERRRAAVGLGTTIVISMLGGFGLGYAMATDVSHLKYGRR